MVLIFLFKERETDNTSVQRRQICFIALYTCAKYIGTANEKKERSLHRKHFFMIIISTMHHYPKEIIAARSCKKHRL